MQFDVFLGGQVVDVILGDASVDLVSVSGPQVIDVVLGPGGLQGAPAQVGFAFSIVGVIEPGEDPIPYTAVGAGPLDASKCVARCSSSGLPTGQVVLILMQNGVQVGTVTWQPGEAIGVVALTSSGYVAGDYFELVLPEVPDPTFAGAAIGFSG